MLPMLPYWVNPWGEYGLTGNLVVCYHLVTTLPFFKERDHLQIDLISCLPLPHVE